VDQLVLVAKRSHELESLASALGAKLIDIQQARAALNGAAPTRCVVLGVPFEVALWADRQSGQGAAAALNAWLIETREILELSRLHRRQVLVLPQDQVLEAQPAALALIQAWQAGKPLPEPVSVQPEAPDFEQLAHKLAAQALAFADAEARHALAELEAVSAPVIDRSVASAAALCDALSASNSGASRSELAALSQTVERSRVALEYASEDLASALAEADELRSELQATRKTVAETKAELEQARKDAESNAGKLALAEDALRAKQGEARDLQAQCEHLQSAIEATRSSTSWKVTAPIRAVKSALSRPEGETGE
jgi:hypothetical protein